MNFEAAQIHFLSDVFAAVAVVVLLMQLMFTVFFFSESSLETLLLKIQKPSNKIILPLLFCFTRNTNGRCSLRLMVKKVSCF